MGITEDKNTFINILYLCVNMICKVYLNPLVNFLLHKKKKSGSLKRVGWNNFKVWKLGKEGLG